MFNVDSLSSDSMSLAILLQVHKRRRRLAVAKGAMLMHKLLWHPGPLCLLTRQQGKLRQQQQRQEHQRQLPCTRVQNKGQGQLPQPNLLLWLVALGE